MFGRDFAHVRQNKMQFHCPHCSGAFQTDPTMAGGQVVCPTCNGMVTIPATHTPGEADIAFTPPEPIPLATTGPPQTDLNCPLCGGIFRATPQMAGLRVGCPLCGGQVTIPAVSMPAPEPPTHAGSPPGGQIPTGPPGGAPPQGMPVTGVMGPAAAEPSVPLGTAVPSTQPPNTPGAAADGPAMPLPASPESIPRSSAPTPPTNTADASQLPAHVAHTSAEQPTPASTNYMYPPGAAQPISTQAGEADQVPATPAAQPTPASTSYMYPPGTAHPDSTQEQAAGVASTTPSTTSAGPSPSTAPNSASQLGLVESGANVAESGTGSKSSKVDAMLPVGASPEQPVSTPATDVPTTSAQSILIPTEEGGYVTLREPVRTIGKGANEVELRTLSAEQKTKRRFKKNVITWFICTIILIGSVLILLQISG